MRIVKTLLAAMTVATAMPALAQLQGNGFYRVLNANTSRYINIIDNRGTVDYASTSVDVTALQTIRGFDNVVNMPGTVIYVREEASYQYSLAAQGTDTKAITGEYLWVTPNADGTYHAWGSKKGLTVYLSDTESLRNPVVSSASTSDSRSTKTTKNWYIKPVKADVDEQYFGIKPEQKDAGGCYWASLYAYFPFKAYSDGMTFYAVDRIQDNKAIVKELTATVPSGTPVLVKCSSATPDGNKLDIVDEAGTAPGTNVLKGVYFCNHNAGHINRTQNSSNVRVLGLTSDGKPALVKASDDYLSEGYLPANKAFAYVADDAAATLELMTETEYQEWLDNGGNTGVETIAASAVAVRKGVYTLSGVRLTSTAGLPSGVYVVDGRKVVVK